MPLEILLPLVVLGISGIVLLIRLLRPTPDLRFDDTEVATVMWNHRNHDAPAIATHLNMAGSHALIETAKGCGLLWSFGADPVSRLLDHPFDLVEAGLHVQINTHDFTAPVIDIGFSDAAEQAEWVELLKAKS